MTTIDITSQLIPWMFFGGVSFAIIGAMISGAEDIDDERNVGVNMFLIGIGLMIPEVVLFLWHLVTNVNIRW